MLESRSSRETVFAVVIELLAFVSLTWIRMDSGDSLSSSIWTAMKFLGFLNAAILGLALVSYWVSKGAE